MAQPPNQQPPAQEDQDEDEEGGEDQAPPGLMADGLVVLLASLGVEPSETTEPLEPGKQLWGASLRDQVNLCLAYTLNFVLPSPLSRTTLPSMCVAMTG